MEHLRVMHKADLSVRPFLVFNGRANYHGLVPPEVISEDEAHAWYGSTVLMKSLQH